MGIRDQRIEIGFSMKTIVRCVYDIRNNEKYKFQTGYVQFDNNEVPVWRPYEPSDFSLGASWRDGKWKNIFILRMNQKKGTTYIEYESFEHEFEGVLIPLPMVSSEPMHAFREHIRKIKANKA